MSDGVNDEVGSITEGGTKRAGRVRICKECRFTTTNVREFSNHRLYAHAEDNQEEKVVTNRKTAAKRRSSSAVSSSVEEQKNKVDEQKNKVDEQKNKSAVVSEKTEKFKETIDENKLTENKDDKAASSGISSEVNSKDIPDDKTYQGDQDSSIEQNSVDKPEQISEVISDLKNTEEVNKMEGEKISPELLKCLDLAPRKASEPTENGKTERKNSGGFGKHSSEKILIEKQNGTTEEVLLIKRDVDHDDEPRLVIADDCESDIMDHSGLDPNSPSRNGNIHNRTYLCNSCDYSTTNAKSYLHHQKDSHHPEIMIYECNMCDYATKYKQKLPRHRKIHFNGRDGFVESDLDNSLTERELREMKEYSSFNADIVNGEEEMDDEGEMDDDEEEEIALALTGASPSMVAHPGVGPPVEKKKRIRQEVDPLKYFEVVDESGVKYACSKCGNVYKWRKSLNKHWKEKHFGEVPDLTKPPPTLQSYTLFSRYKPKAGGNPPPPAAPNVVYGAAIPSPGPTQPKVRLTPGMKSDEEAKQRSNLVMPRQIGPFISSVSPDIFQNHFLSIAAPGGRMPENHHEMRKMIDELQRRSDAMKNRKGRGADRNSPLKENSNSQNEPIDYSRPIDFSKKTDVKSEPSWGDNNSESADSLQEIPLSLSQVNSQIALAMKQSISAGADGESPVLHCNKCSFVAKTLVDYSTHMSLHLNKRAFKCAECQSHFNTVEELNKHFLDNHSEKIQEHKEAIQKIPHGLQQTYHLLKMPLDSISNLSTQELLSNEPKQLKCSMCHFIAKWPAELQKHAVSHSEERPFICMVCGSTYKWKWDLVKHFEKSHNSLPNPYKRREGGGVVSSPSTPPLESISRAASALMEADNYMMDDETPPSKKRRLSETDSQDTEEFYRELLERQIKHKREMVQTPEMMQLPNRPHSASSNLDDEYSLLSSRDNGNAGYQRSDRMDTSTPKHTITEALKNRIQSGKQLEEETTPTTKESSKGGKSEVVLPYKCSVCEYRARWPSEISQHMKNHSNAKPFHCPRCSYKSKWKWDVVKHLRRCGGGTVNDVIDTSKMNKMAPPNVMVMPQVNMQQHQQQQQMMQAHKVSQGQNLYPSNHRAQSLNSAINTLSRMSGTNFSLAAGGQEHQAMLDMMSQNGHQGKSGNGQQIYNSIERDGLFHCLECPFVGNSHAELKRHAVLHSENKPFSCGMCGYSSRWKCDLKKHMKVYNHFGPPETSESSNTSMEQDDKYIDLEDESDEEKSTLYMCPQCPYNSYKKSAFDHHLRIHGNLITQDNDVEPINSEPDDSPQKYNCSKCDFHSNDLSSFLQHKRSHSNQSIPAPERQDSVSPIMSESPSPAPSEVSNRTLHLKHRRKPVKQFRCNKCPYICFQRSALMNHDNLHQSQGNDAYLCMFCDYNVFSKNLLLQHMRLHPEYNPAEGSEHDTRVSAAELMEMEELEEKELASEDRKEASLPEENNNIDDYESGFDSMVARIAQNNRTSTPSNLKGTLERSPENNNVKDAVDNNTSGGGGLPCEWCPATFPNVVTLYQHAQSLHPSQLKAQEAGDIAAKQAPRKSSQLADIVKERQREFQVYHQTMVYLPHIQQQFGMKAPQSQSQSNKQLVPLAPKLGQTSDKTQILDDEMITTQQMAIANARKSASQQRRSRSFQCTKCAFTAPNAVTYLRHIERHGSNCKHTCLYCDYSIDRLNLLYQHMKGTHPDKWNGTTDEKIHLSVGVEDSNNNIIEGLSMSEENMNTDEFNGSFNSSMNDESFDGYPEMTYKDNLNFQKQMSMETDQDDFQDQPGSIAMTPLSSRGTKPILVLKGNTIFKDVLIQVCSLDGRKHYKCPKCDYVNNNAANTANHTKQHGLNKKYTCKHCDYSVDNYKHIQHHIDSVHPKELDFVMVNSSPSVSLIDDFTEEIGDAHGLDSQSDMFFSCSKCPYRCTDSEKYQNHLNKHQGNGKYECQLCDYSVDKYALLRYHAQLHSYKFSDKEMEQREDVESNSTSEMEVLENKTDGDSSDPDRIRFKCLCCPYFTFKKTEILKHRLNHVNKSELSCQLCTFTTNETSDLQQHLKFHQIPTGAGNQLQDFTLDPYNDSYKLIEELPDESIETGPDNGDELGETGEIEDDAEVALMEDELRDTFGQIDGKVSMNLNADGVFDSEIQFRTFKCKLCPFSSNSNAEFKKHYRLHGASYKFKCDYCNYSLDRVNLISQHRKLHFREPEFEPTPMTKTLLNKDNDDYEQMLLKVGQEIAYPPSENGSKNVDEASELNNPDKIRYVCNKCPFRCQALKSFKNHMQMHGLTQKYKCDHCDWSVERMNLLYQHRKVHALEPGFDPYPGDIQFLNRSFILESEESSENQIITMDEVANPLPKSNFSSVRKVTKSGQKLHLCKSCPYKTEDANAYSYHKKLHCIQALYKCTECSYSINDVTLLREHIKLHKRDREMLKSTLSHETMHRKCPKCPFISLNKTLLLNHMALHSSGRKHSCNHCDFSTDKQKLIELHSKVHEEGYSDSDSLEEEMGQLMNHSPGVVGPQLYLSQPNLKDMDSDSNDNADLEHKCDECPFSTPSKDELGDHTEHHGSQTKTSLNCTFCTFSCSKEDELLQHAQVHFPSTKLDWDIMKQLRKQHQSYKKNLSSSFQGDKDTDSKSSDENGEPDSTVNDNVREPSKDGKQVGVDSNEPEKTKVYVCQFCEREFNCKATMLQHEKQHLIGT